MTVANFQVISLGRKRGKRVLVNIGLFILSRSIQVEKLNSM